MGYFNTFTVDISSCTRSADQDGCLRSMAWKHHCAKLALPDMESHHRAFFYTYKEQVATNGSLEYTKVGRSEARLQRAETPDDTEVTAPAIHFSKGES